MRSGLDNRAMKHSLTDTVVHTHQHSAHIPAQRTASIHSHFTLKRSQLTHTHSTITPSHYSTIPPSLFAIGPAASKLASHFLPACLLSFLPSSILLSMSLHSLLSVRRTARGRSLICPLLAALCCALLVGSVSAYNYGAGYHGYPYDASRIGEQANVFSCSPTFTITTTTPQQLQTVGVRYASGSSSYTSTAYHIYIGLYSVASGSDTATHTLVAAGNQGAYTSFSGLPGTGLTAQQLDVSNFHYTTATQGVLAVGGNYAVCFLLPQAAPIEAVNGGAYNPYATETDTSQLPTTVAASAFGNLDHNNRVYATTSDVVPVAVPVSSSSSSAAHVPSSSSSSAPSPVASSSSSSLAQAQSSSSSSYSSAASSPVASSSTSTNAAVYADPFFSGFWGQTFYVHGRPGSVYSILSDRAVQLNALFVFLDSVNCPELAADETARVHCSSHAGTYMGEMAIRTSSGDRLHIVAGGVELGFSSVTHIGVYELLIENSDRYVDLVHVAVTNWTTLLTELQPSGLMGRTWNSNASMELSEADEERYRERDSELMGCHVDTDKFCSGGSAAEQRDTAVTAEEAATALPVTAAVNAEQSAQAGAQSQLLSSEIAR